MNKNSNDRIGMLKIPEFRSLGFFLKVVSDYHIGGGAFQQKKNKMLRL
jgi:hypothetical protein